MKNTTTKNTTTKNTTTKRAPAKAPVKKAPVNTATMINDEVTIERMINETSSAIDDALRGNKGLTSRLEFLLTNQLDGVLSDSLYDYVTIARHARAEKYGFSNYIDMINTKNLDTVPELQGDFAGKSHAQIKNALSAITTLGEDGKDLPALNLVKATLGRAPFNRGFKFNKKEQYFIFEVKEKKEKEDPTQDQIDAKCTATIYDLLDKMSDHAKDVLISELVTTGLDVQAKKEQEKMIENTKASKTRFINEAVKQAKKCGVSTIDAKEQAIKDWDLMHADQDVDQDVDQAVAH